MPKGRFRAVFICLLGLSLAACGGSEEQPVSAVEQQPASAIAPSTETTTPSPAVSADEGASEGSTTIGGEPPTAVVAGTAYAFTPTARSRHGHRLTFSIMNAPPWAAFDTRTGRLSGTPGAEHVGTARAIVISVNDGAVITSLAAFDLTVVAVATGSATLTWLPPTTNTDGSPLTNLSGYRVYWGTALGDYPNTVMLDNPGLTTYVVENLAPATYYFTVKSLNTTGIESAFSNAATKTIR